MVFLINNGAKLGINIIENLKNYVLFRKNKGINKKRFENLKINNIPVQKLTSEEKKAADTFLQKYGFKKYSYSTHMLVKSVTGKFYPEIIPEELFKTKMISKFNDFQFKQILADKNYYNMFMPNCKFPKTLIHNIEGSFYDEKYNLLSEESAYEIIARYQNVVIKPTNSSGFGKGVKLVTPSKEIFRKYGNNFIVQEKLHQHDFLSRLNESSCNVIRVNSVFINDTVYTLPAALRIGGVGDFTDNAKHKDGSGMIVVGLDKNGCLGEFGYHSNGTHVDQTPGGIKFKGLVLPNYDKMLEIAKREHTKFPQVRFIAWDFTLDKNGDVVVIEYNTKSPGSLYYQYVNGPLFGEHSDEILKFLSSKK